VSAPLQVKNLTVRFGGLVAVQDLTFDVAAGSILGIIGPNGAGKSTVFEAISGFVRPERGHILLNGEDITRMAPHDRAQRGLGRSFQDGRMFLSLTVAECIGIALQRHIPIAGPLSVLLSGPQARASSRFANRRVDEVIELMGLGDYRDRHVRELSTGTRRLADLACSVAFGADVLLLDEPSSGIAQKEVENLAPLIRRVREETNCTMLLIEHEIPLVVGVSDEMIALETGQLIARGKPADVIADPAVVEAYIGTDKRLRVVGAR
jgi:ABC-type branched-subunit amino acid transport system ATPase component